MQTSADAKLTRNTVLAWHLIKLSVFKVNPLYGVLWFDERLIHGQDVISIARKNAQPCERLIRKDTGRLAVVAIHPKLKLLALSKRPDLTLK